MPTSLGFDGELDDAMMVQDIELSFGFKISDDEWMTFRTVSDVFAVVEANLPAGATGSKCASAITFYRLRRAIQPHLDMPLRPQTPISARADIPVRKLHRIIKNDCQMNAHQFVGWSMWKLAALLAVPSFPFVAAALGLGDWGALASVLIAIGLFIAAPLRLPHTVHTFGDLVRLVSSQNSGALAQQGARLTGRQAWEALREILAQHTSLPKEQISRDTLIYHPEFNFAKR